MLYSASVSAAKEGLRYSEQTDSQKYRLLGWSDVLGIDSHCTMVTITTLVMTRTAFLEVTFATV